MLTTPAHMLSRTHHHRYITFIKDNMYKFFPEALPKFGWIGVLLVPALCFSIPDRVGFLAPFSLFGLACAFAYGTLVVNNAVHDMSADVFWDRLASQPFIKPKTLPLALSTPPFRRDAVACF